MIDSREKNWLIRDKYKGDHSQDLSLDIERLNKGEPIDYVIGWKEFLNCKIGLDQRPLIPRPETEYWVETAIKKISKEEVDCLDIFAGSGCVGLAVLKNCPNTRVDFAEKDKKLLGQIETNLEVNSLDKKRWAIFESNIFSGVTGKYDYIFANPPYVPGTRKLAKTVANWEPAMALYGGRDGLLIINKFLNELGSHLKPGGEVWLEFDVSQKKYLEEEIEKLGYTNIQFHKDQYSRWRFVTFSN